MKLDVAPALLLLAVFNKPQVAQSHGSHPLQRVGGSDSSNATALSSRSGGGSGSGNATRREAAVSAHIGIFMLSTAKHGGQWWRQNAMAAHQTWARPFPLVFYVMGDSPTSRFAFRQCGLKWTHADEAPEEDRGGAWPRYDPYLSTFLAGRCHNEPAVLLTPACDDSYYGATGPCCKLDATITFATSKSAERQVCVPRLVTGGGGSRCRDFQFL